MNTNQKVIAGIIILGLSATGVAFAASNTSTGSGMFQRSQLTDEQKAQFQQVKTVLEKKKAGENITPDEQTLLDTWHENRLGGREGKGKRGGMGDRHERGGEGFGPGFGPGMQELTDEEKTALASMTDEQKKTFFETKRVQEEAKRDAREAVIDKLLDGQTLTEADKGIVEEIKAQRALHKAQKAKMDEARTLMQKERSGETLTSDEQAKLTELKASFPQRGMRGPRHESDTGTTTE